MVEAEEGLSRENSRSGTPAKGATDTDSMAQQDYVTPMEARNHLREVWTKEADFLKVVLGALNIKMLNTEYPVDVFFLSVLPVPPLRFRPVSCVACMPNHVLIVYLQ